MRFAREGATRFSPLSLSSWLYIMLYLVFEWEMYTSPDLLIFLGLPCLTSRYVEFWDWSFVRFVLVSGCCFVVLMFGGRVVCGCVLSQAVQARGQGEAEQQRRLSCEEVEMLGFGLCGFGCQVWCSRRLILTLCSFVVLRTRFAY